MCVFASQTAGFCSCVSTRVCVCARPCPTHAHLSTSTTSVYTSLQPPGTHECVSMYAARHSMCTCGTYIHVKHAHTHTRTPPVCRSTQAGPHTCVTTPVTQSGLSPAGSRFNRVPPSLAPNQLLPLRPPQPIGSRAASALIWGEPLAVAWQPGGVCLRVWCVSAGARVPALNIAAAGAGAPEIARLYLAAGPRRPLQLLFWG